MKRQLRKLSRVTPDMIRLASRDFLGRAGDDRDATDSREAAIAWICRAQDVTPDGGVAAAWTFFDGWLPSYPETTGYIAQTFVDLHRTHGRPELLDRAVRMGDWEIQIQLPSGAVIAGYHTPDGPPARPAVFNAGQVILGWCALYDATRQERYLEASRRAGDWLLEMQDGDGAWRRGLSPLGTADPSPVRTYKSRVAWSLLELARLTDHEPYRDAAMRNLEWVLAQQAENYWFRNNSFSTRTDPLTHNINYAIEGLLGSWHLCRDARFLDAARGALEAQMRCFERDGRLAATFDSDWRPTSNYACLTGNAQFARNLFDLFGITGDPRYLAAGARILNQVKSYQILDDGRAPYRGAIPASHPIYGGYGAFVFNNWTVKFFLDALLLEFRTGRVEAAPAMQE